jgi:hypothetical protein
MTKPNNVARIERSEIRGRMCGLSTAPDFTLFNPGYQTTKQRKGSRTPASAVHQPPHRKVRHAPRKERLAPPSARARSPAGVPPRARWAVVTSQLSSRPCFLGLGGSARSYGPPCGEDRTHLHGRYPRPPVPVQGFNTRTGRSAGGLIPEAARVAKVMSLRPRAPHSPLPDGITRRRPFRARI